MVDFEGQVGVVAYISPLLLNIKGILKQRYSDFIVREIGLDNITSELHEINALDVESKWFNSTFNGNDNINADLNGLKVWNAVIQNNPNEGIDENLQSIFIEFVDKCLSHDEDCPREFIGFSSKNKEFRSSVHKVTKAMIGNFVENETAMIDGVQNIRLVAKHLRDKNKSHETGKRKRLEWPSELGNYLRFTLLKENIDTMSAINILGKAVHIRPSNFGYYGTKDKRAITVQKCTVFRKKPSDLMRINYYSFPPIIRVGDFEYIQQPAKLGDILGNQFEIIMRALEGSESDVNEICKSIFTHGFINYFGLQRFGKGGSKSHDIGRAIFKSDWKLCVDMLFTTRDGDKEEIVMAKKFYQSGQFQEAISHLPNQLYGEKLVLQCLISKPSDYLSAYNAIAKNVRLICAHAYQSYIWNKAVTFRMQRFGVAVVPGDLVATRKDEGINVSSVNSFAVDDGELLLLEESDDLPVEKESRAELSDRNQFQRSSHPNINIQCITEDELRLNPNKWTIKDVLMPLPGHSIQLPQNEVGQYYVDLLKEDGLQLSDYSTCGVMYRMSGAYRRIVQVPEKFEWKIFPYANLNDELVETEMIRFRAPLVKKGKNVKSIDDSITNMGEGKETEAFDGSAPVLNCKSTDIINSNENPQPTDRRALALKFVLPQGTYATMLIRELTKESTDTQFHAKLTSENVNKSALTFIDESCTVVNESSVKITDAMEMNRTPSSNSTVIVAEPEITKPNVLVLKIRAKKGLKKNASGDNANKIKWSEDTIDNEFMNKRNSKRCCIFHKKKEFAESDSDESDSDVDEAAKSNPKFVSPPVHLRHHA